MVGLAVETVVVVVVGGVVVRPSEMTPPTETSQNVATTQAPGYSDSSVDPRYLR